MVAWALWLDTATHDNGQFPQAIQPGHCAGAVIADPQRLTALLTRLFQRGQSDCVRRFLARSSSSHLFSPALRLLCFSVLFLLVDYTPCQAPLSVQRFFPSGQKRSGSSSSPAILEGSEESLTLVAEAKARELL